ncbi:lamin tail domain-containing protein, partial [bacterium]|nr:lamin tail domain-containing protein [bacterium]
MFNRFIIFLSALLLWLPGVQSAPTDSVTITEVMFNPTSGNNEFIEIYNYGSQAYNLSQWKIKDNLELDTIKNAGFGITLNPGQFAIIFENDYDIATGLYKDMIPVGALILKIDDALIGNGLGNTSDVIYLITNTADTLSVYSYSSSNPVSFSDEKIKLDNDNSVSNWINSFYTNGTPGAPPESVNTPPKSISKPDQDKPKGIA